MKREEVEAFSGSLPEATVEPHFHFKSFRIGGKIFATMPPALDVVHVFAPAEEREVATTVFPDCCEALQWGKSTVGVKVDFTLANDEFLRNLLRAAYRDRAAKAGISVPDEDGGEH